GRHRSRINGGNIAVGQQNEPPQIFLRSHSRGEKSRGGRVFEVAAVHDQRNVEVALDQENDTFLQSRGNVNTIHRGMGSRNRAAHVFTRIGSLSDVMLEQREAENDDIVLL